MKSIKSMQDLSLNLATSSLWPHAKSSLTEIARKSELPLFSFFLMDVSIQTTIRTAIIEFFAIADIAVFKPKSCFLRSKT